MKNNINIAVVGLGQVGIYFLNEHRQQIFKGFFG